MGPLVRLHPRHRRDRDRFLELLQAPADRVLEVRLHRQNVELVVPDRVEAKLPEAWFRLIGFRILVVLERSPTSTGGDENSLP